METYVPDVKITYDVAAGLTSTRVRGSDFHIAIVSSSATIASGQILLASGKCDFEQRTRGALTSSTIIWSLAAGFLGSSGTNAPPALRIPNMAITAKGVLSNRIGTYLPFKSPTLLARKFATCWLSL